MHQSKCALKLHTCNHPISLTLSNIPNVWALSGKSCKMVSLFMVLSYANLAMPASRESVDDANPSKHVHFDGLLGKEPSRSCLTDLKSI